MAHPVEPMDIDSSVCEFDNKENTSHHSNVLSRTPCTEKGYEELDVSELNIKLRYSVTPASSPMSKSYTANCLDNRAFENDTSVTGIENNNLSRSFNATITRNDSTIKSQMVLPLQELSTDHTEVNRNVLRPKDAAIIDNNVTVTIIGHNDIDENISLPSSSCSTTHTPEATTPTKEISKEDGSPIIRGLKSVLNMFRPSQSPIPSETEGLSSKTDIASPPIVNSPENSTEKPQVMLASTPLAAQKTKDALGKKNSLNQNSLVFNEDLKKELEWKDETTILFSHEKIPIHKLFLQGNPKNPKKDPDNIYQGGIQNVVDNLDSTAEYMDISYNTSIKDKTINEIKNDKLIEMNTPVESDSEFVDCESTFTKQDSQREEFIKMNENNNCKDNNDHIKGNTSQITESLNLHVDSSDLSAALRDTLKDIEGLLPNSDSAKQDNEDLKQEITEVCQNPVDITRNKDEQQTKAVINLTVSKTVEESINQSKLNMEDGILMKESLILSDYTVNLDGKQSVPAININLGSNALESNSNTSINNSQAVANTNKEAGAMPTPESLVVNTLSQIPLIADPRVLLFNIPTEENIPDAVQNCDLIVSPADIPLPDDDDIHTLESLPSLEMGLEKIEEKNEGNSLGHELVTVILQPIEHLPEIKSNEAQCNEIMDTIKQNIVPNMEVKADSLSSTLISNVDVEETLSKPIVLDTIPDTIESNTVTISESIQNSITECAQQKNTQVKSELSSITEILKDEVSSGVIMNEDFSCKMNEVDKRDSTPEIEELLSLLSPEAAKDACESLSVIDHVLNLHEDQVHQNITEDRNYSINLKNMEDVKLYNNAIRAPEKTVEEENQAETTINVAEIHGDIALVSDTTIDVLANIDTFINREVVEVKEDRNLNIPQQEITQTANSCILDAMVDVSMVSIKDITITGSDKLENTVNDNDVLRTEHVIDTPKTENIENNALKVDLIVPQIDNDKECFESVEAKLKEEEYNENSHGSLNNITNQEKSKQIEIVNENETTLIGIVENRANTPTNSNNMRIDQVLHTSKVDITENESLKVAVTAPQTDIDKLGHLNIENTVSDAVEKVLNFQLAKQQANDAKIHIQNTENIEQATILMVADTAEEKMELDEEVLASENNSPFVSVTSDFPTEEKLTDNFEDIVNPFTTNAKLAIFPPISPKIVSKGYNFNFDEIDDPFATNTKIRLSPPLDAIAVQSFDQLENLNTRQNEETEELAKLPQKDINNRRRSQPERKKSSNVNKKINATIGGKSNMSKPVQRIQTKQTPGVDDKINNSKKVHVLTAVEISEKPVDTFDNQTNSVVTENTDDINSFKNIDEACNKTKIIEDSKELPVIDAPESITESEDVPFEESTKSFEQENKTSSSEQSAYYSAGSSSSECKNESRNVFNIPEIDDRNFNPFATKNKLRATPPTHTITNSQDVGNNSEENSGTILACTAGQEHLFMAGDKLELKSEDSSGNISSGTSSSKNTNDMTVREINTEDEDTIEGPFLEADDLNNDEQSDMTPFHMPTNIEGNEEAGEMFIDAEAFEFLLNQNKSNIVADSGKESLFLKFDPLFAKRMSSDGVVAALAKAHKKQSTPNKMQMPQNSTFIEKSLIAGTSNLNLTQDVEHSTIVDGSIDDLNVTVSKPMMVVNPAVNPVVTPRNKFASPPVSNRRSLTFTSPAIAVIDRLLSLSANNSFVSHDTTVAEVSRDDNEADLALTQLREMLADKEISVYNLRTENKELRERLSNIESQVKALETISEEKMKKINELSEKLNEKTKLNKSMANVVEEYERTIASLIAETEQDRKRHAEERIQLMKERDEQTAHLASMEVSFSDLHSKYEKSKQVILGFKTNEDSYKKSIKEFEENLAKMQNNYELLKQHATSKLNHANEELQKINRTHEAEVLKLNAMIKRKELHITSLEETLSQKTKANDELTAICDELINKVG